MTDELKERVKALAVEAGFGIVHSEAAGQLFERFAQAVARECAKLADDKALEIRLYCNEAHVVAVGAAIRARYGLGE